MLPSALPCPKCGQEMLPINYGGSIYECTTCGIHSTIEQHEGWPDGKKITFYAGAVDPLTGERDCHCGHSWYDHIGWRMKNGEYKTSRCRIVRCGCESYTAKWA